MGVLGGGGVKVYVGIEVSFQKCGRSEVVGFNGFD
jgi:hypothetical protein